MTIKITIKKESKAAKAIKAHMADKMAFAQAVKEGNVVNFMKKTISNVASPVPAR
jgi:hypothetical protein